MTNKWKTRLPEMETLLLNGTTYVELAIKYGVSRQRIEQIIRQHLSHLKKEDIGAAIRATRRRAKRAADTLAIYQQRFNRNSWYPESDLEAAFSLYFTRKRQNVKNQGKWEFNIHMSDVPDWPLICPILGIELDWFAEYRQENSPSLDRIDPKQGYVVGNVQIISWRANRIKNDGSAEEHRLIADYLDSLEKTL